MKKIQPKPKFNWYWNRIISVGLLVCFITILTACDFEVTNPGPVQDEFLNEPGARQAIVNGIARDLSDALNWVGFRSAAVTREIHPSGSTFSYGISPRAQVGLLPDDETDTYWDFSQRSRWTASHAIERLQETMEQEEFNSSELVAQAYLWQGYANRLLGENFCRAVIDGGEPENYQAFLNHADEAFTNAISSAQAVGDPDIELAALAGRASVRRYLGDFPGAVADAEQIPFEFVFEMPYNQVEQDQHNRIFESSADNPYRAHTVWQTYYEEYFEEFNDPRTPWGFDPDRPVGDAAVGNLGNVPWYFQLKYDSPDDPIKLSSGREMVLIEAEAELSSGNWADAMTLINSLRNDVGVDEWVAANETEAWTYLKRERGIELWLEARRLGDLRLWDENNTPGELHPLEAQGGELPLSSDRSLCFPIPESELDTNPNI
ncbi:RagB/SusD family nutrient uptake outer membrane protein [Rhodohalobacter sp. SW132]|uniref:RagB/SusD family nutrient uptake outer membrane protein n=1 Tax=Rhodohalobacter sp. SW132 TaxID=2293433 RepID=UPI0013148ABA|nr:RagB/SusD family nutrient uptake outer membrane protein [Rhodohalobacter sp. SW132]